MAADGRHQSQQTVRAAGQKPADCAAKVLIAAIPGRVIGAAEDSNTGACHPIDHVEESC